MSERHHHDHTHDHEHGHDHQHGACCAHGGEELIVLDDLHDVQAEAGSDRSVVQVEGMDCGECARTVERVVSKLDGVDEVRVNFSTTKMAVRHTADLDAILRAVKQVGYQPTVLETSSQSGTPQMEQAPPSFWQKQYRTISTAISGVFLGLGMLVESASLATMQVAIACYLVAMLIGGWPVARAAFYALRSRTLDMNFLMTAAAIGAAAIGEWAEGATVVFLFSVGNWLQAQTMERTRRSIRSLMDLTPKTALVRRANGEQQLPLTDIHVRDIVIVRPGERIPMDGHVLAGRSAVNQAPVTGESLPVAKERGDDVYAGTINETGALEIEVTKRVEDSALARIIHLVEEAQAQRAPSQQFVDKFAAIYTPAVVVLAVLVAFLPPLLFAASFSEWVYRALALLVIACPCALVISTPVSIVAAIGSAAKQGVLIKGGAFLEQMGAVRAIAFDKTGTLTVGQPQVVHTEAYSDHTEASLLRVAAAVEARSEHPLARAILAAQADAAGATALPPVTDFQALAGKGAQGIVDHQLVQIGSPNWFRDLQVAGVQPLEQTIAAHQEKGRTVMLVAVDGHLSGLLAVADAIRPESSKTLQSLRAAGILHTALLTGDNKRTAAAVGAELGVDDVHGELLPEQKWEQIRALRAQHGPVAMVGDGINDAPALASADIGIAMGGAGTDAALETADIVLMADDLSRLPFAVQLSRRALAIIKQNIAFSLVVKLAFLILTLLGEANLWMAVFADTGAALLVIANGMRLMSQRPS